MPIIPAKSAILFPEEAVVLQLVSKQNLLLVEESVSLDKQVGVVFSPDGNIKDNNLELCQVGTLARIISRKKGPGKSEIVVMEGINRIFLKSISHKTPYLVAEVDVISDDEALVGSSGKYIESVINLISQITKANPAHSGSLLHIVRLNFENPGKLADRIAAAFHFPIEVKQEILESIEIDVRLKALQHHLKIELAKAASYDHPPGENESTDPFRGSLNAFQRGFDSFGNEVVRELQARVKNNKLLPDTVREKCQIEIDRLRHLPAASADYGTARQYLDWLLGIPWNITSPEERDLKQVEKNIDRLYFGPQNIKKKILERIAIRQLSGGLGEASVLCLAGAPGTGKASLAKAIAKSLGKKFMRISIGGIDDIDDIKGSPRTFIGAMPGIFARTLKNAGTCDPIVFLENIDYFEEDGNAFLLIALLEAIDPRHNSSFMDDYIGFPVDLSKTFFICSVKSADDIPEVLTPRLEVIDLPGYIEKDKMHIARKYIIPELLKKHGILRREIKFTAAGLRKIIRNYTLEAGLMNFKRRLQVICRHVAREKASRIKKIWVISDKSVESILGTRQYTPEKPGQSPEIGVATGLAWTGQGGDLMIIEGIKMKGSGEVISTGSLGDVMKESIQAAHSYVRSKADVLGIDHADFDNFDIHIHFPSGAIPKDGPSAGVAVSLVIASVMAERPIANDVAMTGEVTLRGKVLQVGGLIEKVSAAYRAGIPKIFIPKSNKKDLKDLPADILKKTKFILIESVDEAFAEGLLDFVPSSYTLEKLFAKELEKAKNRKKSRTTSPIAAKSPRKK